MNASPKLPRAARVFLLRLVDENGARRGLPPVFRPSAGPGANEPHRLVEQMGARLGEVLERRGLIERDLEKAWPATDVVAGPLDDLIRHSITYRIAVGPRVGQWLFTLQTVPPRLPGLEGDAARAARAGGFSLHAGVDIAASEREKLERLCRYVSRPPVATERLALTPRARCATRSRRHTACVRRARGLRYVESPGTTREVVEMLRCVLVKFTWFRFQHACSQGRRP